MIQVKETKQRLQQLVEASGLSEEEASFSLGWETFKQFALEPVKCAQDELFIYIGPDRLRGEQFIARLGRDFEVNDYEKYFDHSESVSLLFTTEPSEALDGYRFSLSTRMGFTAFEPFFVKVEGEAAFRAAAAHPSWRYSIKVWTPNAA
jgi:hypothetical protein